MMKHYFRTDIAKECGVNAAIVYENLAYWIDHNKSKGKNLKDGKYWTYQTIKELSENFEYLSEKQVRTAVEKLEAAGHIIKGNYNRSGYDRTTWYTVAVEEAQETAITEPTSAPQDESIELQPAPVETRINAHKHAHSKKRPQRQKQKPIRVEPLPLWATPNAQKSEPIQDIKEFEKRKLLLNRMRKLADDCGAVCTV